MIIIFKIAICDDDILVCSKIERVIAKFDDKIKMEIFYSGERLISEMQKSAQYDLIFLDIEMEKLNGVDVGKNIREKIENNSTQIVYISSKESYAMELFKVRPFDFLVKPLKSSVIIETIKKVINLTSKMNLFYDVIFDGIHTKLPIKDILYFESQSRKVRIITTHGEYFTYARLFEIEDEIEHDDFYLVHKSYFVNFMHIKKYSYDELTMVNDSVIPISQSNRKMVRSYFLNKRGENND